MPSAPSKLPDFTALGQKTASPAGPIPHYSAAGFVDTEGPKQLVKLGNELVDIAYQKTKEQDQIDTATADADMTVARDKILQEESENPDYAGAPGRYQQRIDEQAASIAGRFRTDRQRQLWTQQQRITSERGRFHLSTEAHKKWGDDTIAANDQKYEDIGKSALQEQDPFDRYDKLKQIDAGIEAERKQGILTRAQAAARKKGFTEKYAYTFSIDEMRKDPIGFRERMNQRYPDGFEGDPPPAGSTLEKERKTMTDIGEQVEPLIRQKRTGRYFDPNTGKIYDKSGEPVEGLGKSGASGKSSDNAPASVKASWNALDLPARYTSAVIELESGGKTGQVTGSYVGLGQFSPEEQRKYGITNPDNRGQVVTALKREAAEFAPMIQAAIGRAPTSAELYLAHQQGIGGIINHLKNPDEKAWVNMANTGEGRRKKDPEGWAKRAIWGNMSKQMKFMFPGGVDTVDSSSFVALWAQRYERAERQVVAAD